ncbi:hypothetical protein EI94DRAFT_1799782 [Lactarius quietus]|nr:hypothetical protein EI94DRAFT_1799782 [Lactarius quietus]
MLRCAAQADVPSARSHRTMCATCVSTVHRLRAVALPLSPLSPIAHLAPPVGHPTWPHPCSSPSDVVSHRAGRRSVSTQSPHHVRHLCIDVSSSARCRPSPLSSLPHRPSPATHRAPYPCSSPPDAASRRAGRRSVGMQSPHHVHHLRIDCSLSARHRPSPLPPLAHHPSPIAHRPPPVAPAPHPCSSPPDAASHRAGRRSVSTQSPHHVRYLRIDGSVCAPSPFPSLLSPPSPIARHPSRLHPTPARHPWTLRRATQADIPVGTQSPHHVRYLRIDGSRLHAVALLLSPLSPIASSPAPPPRAHADGSSLPE